MPRILSHIISKALFLYLITIIGCTDQADLELESTYPRLVVEGEVTSDSVRHQVRLSITSDYFFNKPPEGLSDATVELSFDDEVLLLQENEQEAGLYETPAAFPGIPGTTYELDISNVDIDQDGQYESYRAKTTMPAGSELHSIELRYYTTPVLSGYVVFMYANHPPEQSDWFGFKFLKNGDMLTDSLTKYRVFADDLFDDGYFPGLPVGFFSDSDPRQALHPGDTLTLELNCIEQAYFDFISSAQLEIAPSYPLFSGPPANVSSNIDNGAFGTFTAYNVLRASLIIN